MVEKAKVKKKKKEKKNSIASIMNNQDIDEGECYNCTFIKQKIACSFFESFFLYIRKISKLF